MGDIDNQTYEDKMKHWETAVRVQDQEYTAQFKAWEEAENNRMRQIYEETQRGWETYYQGQEEELRKYDKNIAAFSAGSFGVSFAFIDKIVPLSGALYKQLLVSSWACFGLCLVISLLSFLLAAGVFNTLCKETAKAADFRYRGETPPEKKHLLRLTLSPICNWSSLAAFLGGVGCLLTFVLLNF